MPARLLMIALDGADSVTLAALTEAGTLPNLAALRARGMTGRLACPPGTTDDGIWASIQYGCGLGGHGRYFYLQEGVSGRMQMIHTAETEDETFWDRLSRNGMRVAIFDVPKCREPRALNGIHLADWLVHGHYDRKPRSFPPGFAEETEARFGPEPPSRCNAENANFDAATSQSILANLEQSAAMKRDAALETLRAEDWDLFFVAFKEGHCAGHTFWGLESPLPDAPPPLETVLKCLDAAVGELMGAAGDEAVIAVFTTSAITSNASIDHLAPQLVHRLNRTLGASPLQMLGNRITSRTGRRRYRRLFGTPPLGILPYNESCLALRIEVPSHRDEIADTAERFLVGLADAESGKAIVAGVDRPSRDQDGPRRSRLPDMLVRLVPGAIPRAVAAPGLGRIEAPVPSYRAGNHAGDGFFIAAGADGAASSMTKISDLARFCGLVLGAPEVDPVAGQPSG